ncbi:MAG: sarcosine oxidase subunit delta [Acidiphilium sp.]|nr:sarcosine oxidase subunit delta [Acidiphilium sp.]MDD4936214.1 sarcosine oxidase subunit delta [Acidiphilium sp.]
MRIACPYCGPRGLEEFLYHGDASVRRPEDGGAVPDQAWTDYVYLRENANGPHRELWYHHAGCHAWLVVTRDLRSHDILGVTAARDEA